MDKFSFKNDYSEGAHPKVLEFLSKNNFDQQIPYGEDDFCISSKKMIQKSLQNTKAEIHFVNGGTMSNLLVISHLLRPYEAVIAATTAHINIHETGSIEAIGHKIITANSQDGKIRVSQIENILQDHVDEHKVIPKLVYISQSTELGTIYTQEELSDLSQFCKKNRLYFYLDGARIAQALASLYSDVSFKDISEYTDAFYIGATKNGALSGEAIVFNNPEMNANFRYTMKQKGALIAKGRFLGLQFEALFKDDLFLQLGKKANDASFKMAATLERFDYPFLVPTETNQIFPILPHSLIDFLLEKFEFYVWKKIDEHQSAVRLVTSWATPDDEIERFINNLEIFHSS